MVQLTPTARIELYRSIARLWRAGISPLVIGTQVLASARDAVSRTVATVLTEGRSLAEAMEAVPADGIPASHRMIVEAAERSGRIPETLDELATDDEAAIHLRTQTLGKVAYPLLVFHVAMFVMAPAAVVTGNYGTLVLPICFTIVIDVVLVTLYRVLFFDTPSAFVDRITLNVPILGSIRTSADARRYLATTNHLYEAGIALPEAMRRAAAALRRPVLRAQLHDALARIPPETEPFGHLDLAFPKYAMLTSTLRTGFMTGDLSAAIRQIVRPMAEDEAAQTRRFVAAVGGLLFAAAAVLVAVIAIRFYGGLFAGLR